MNEFSCPGIRVQQYIWKIDQVIKVYKDIVIFFLSFLIR